MSVSGRRNDEERQRLVSIEDIFNVARDKELANGAEDLIETGSGSHITRCSARPPEGRGISKDTAERSSLPINWAQWIAAERQRL
jgi:hypothetical protein